MSFLLCCEEHQCTIFLFAGKHNVPLTFVLNRIQLLLNNKMQADSNLVNAPLLMCYLHSAAIFRMIMFCGVKIQLFILTVQAYSSRGRVPHGKLRELNTIEKHQCLDCLQGSSTVFLASLFFYNQTQHTYLWF